jgi:hypothetical protein
MKTLVIHPSDYSTDFLKPIYEGIEDKTVITQGKTRDEIIELIESHDRVMMMGHGSPSGLFGIGFNRLFVIDNGLVEYLNKKDNNVFIWCNADRFVNRFGLKGFYTGMFISEVGEAYYCGLPNIPQNVVDESNNQFANWVGELFTSKKPLNEVYSNIVDSYGKLANKNIVAKYNHERLYLAN